MKTSELKQTTNENATGAILKFSGKKRNFGHVITALFD